MLGIRPLIVLGLGLLLTLAVAGCSGDSTSPSAAGAVAGDGAGINFSESAARLDTLKSFRFSAIASIDYQGAIPPAAEDPMTAGILNLLLAGLKDVKVEGAVVAPDQMEVSVQMSGLDLGFVQIGDRAWMKFMGGWQSVEPGDLGLESGLDFSELAAGVLPPDVVNAARVTKEKVNGIEATRYSFDKAALQSLAQDVAAGQDIESANMDVWLTADGVPVKMALKMAGTDENGQKANIQFEFALKDLNSNNITIKAPN